MRLVIRTFRRAANISVTCALGLAATAQAQAQEQADEQARKAGAPSGLLSCPILQTPVKSSARPNPALFQQIVRCEWGERRASPGSVAVQVAVASMQAGNPRRWSMRSDRGNGEAGRTLVYPVRATFTVKRFYDDATEVDEGWTRVFNFYVDPSFGEWKVSSQEPVRPPTTRRIERD